MTDDLTDSEEKALDIILDSGPSEDNNTVQTEDTPDEVLSIISRQDVVLDTNTWYSPESLDDSGNVNSFPIKGDGSLEDFVVVADRNDFAVSVNVDDETVVDSDFTSLSHMSDELSHVSAYSRETQNVTSYVVSVSDYPFDNLLDIRIKPTIDNIGPDNNLTLEVIRAEVIA